MENEGKDKISRLKEKANWYIKNKPRNIFFGMIGICVFSMVMNLGYYFLVVKNSQEKYEKIKDVFSAKNNPVIRDIEASSNSINEYYEIKKDMERIEEIKDKGILNKEDSIYIEEVQQKYKGKL